MLLHDLTIPPGASDGATVAVLLHGRGSHRGDLQALASHLPAWPLMTPQAPNPGQPWGYGPGWAWYRYVAEDRLEDATLETSLEAVDHLLATLPDALGFEPGRVVLGGFSQGGTTSLAHGLTRPGAAAAVLNFSGFLPDSTLIPTSAPPDAPPVFWGHGTRDGNIPHTLAVRGRERLREMGVRVEARDYDVGHWIEPAELADAVAFVGDLDG